MSVAARLLRTRRLARAPIVMFRAGLGFVFGGRLLMLEHVGRRSGERRYVVLEVVHRPRPDEVVVASGLGRRSQWYQNLQATPRCHVSIGARRRVPATAANLGPGEAEDVLARYRRDHPVAWRRVVAAVSEVTGEEDPEIPLVRLVMTAGGA